MATTTTTLIYWNPTVVTGPIAAAHQIAVGEAQKLAQSLAPGHIAISAEPSDTNTANLKATGPGAVQQEYGAKPHIIAPKEDDGNLAGKGFGPISGSVQHPGNPALHYVKRGADFYPTAFTSTAKRLFI